MEARAYDALVLDLDGTLLDDRSRVHPDNLSALQRAVREGVRVMVATGRSLESARPVLSELGLDSLAVVFNGAAVYCPARDRMIEERVLSGRTLGRMLEFGASRGHLMVAMCAARKYAMRPRNEWESAALAGMTGVELVDGTLRDLEFVIRVTLFADRTAPAGVPADADGAYARDLVAEIEREVAQPMYVTDFPLNVLPSHRLSPLHVVDVHAPCRGKAESLRVLRETYGIPPERVVAVGDATNDLPMLEAAGLAVAMEDGMIEARRAADRIIGSCNTPAIAHLVDEIFLSRTVRGLGKS